MLTTLTTCEISGRVQAITYKMLPTILAYRTHDMCSFLSSISDKPKDNMKWIASGENSLVAVFHTKILKYLLNILPL